MVNVSRAALIVGLCGLIHAAYSAAQHRSYIRLTEQEYSSLPADIVVQIVLSFITVCIGLFGLTGNLKEIEAAAEFRDKFDHCSSVKFNVNKSNILYGAYGQEIVSWDIRNLAEPLAVWKVNDEEINSIDVSGNEYRLSSADNSGAIQIIDLNTGLIMRTLKKHDNICSSARFRPGRTWQLVSGGLDCRVVVSDWKGSGLGVIIFEMDEIVETLDQVFQLRPNGADQRHESVASSDDNAEIDNLNGPEDDFEATSVEATFANEQSLVFVEESSQSSSSGLGSDSRSERSVVNDDEDDAGVTNDHTYSRVVTQNEMHSHMLRVITYHLIILLGELVYQPIVLWFIPSLVRHLGILSPLDSKAVPLNYLPEWKTS
ncbi:unnamed protein product [Heterobilharzia americana]|nr:unnamed protein product [Heterobilharzia americana]